MHIGRRGRIYAHCHSHAGSVWSRSRTVRVCVCVCTCVFCWFFWILVLRRFAGNGVDTVLLLLSVPLVGKFGRRVGKCTFQIFRRVRLFVWLHILMIVLCWFSMVILYVVFTKRNLIACLLRNNTIVELESSYRWGVQWI